VVDGLALFFLLPPFAVVNFDLVTRFKNKEGTVQVKVETSTGQNLSKWLRSNSRLSLWPVFETEL
jgi:hypothetical protein